MSAVLWCSVLGDVSLESVESLLSFEWLVVRLAQRLAAVEAGMWRLG